MTDHLDFEPPTGLLVRGTVLVVPGRGETAWTYNRLGNRLAVDAYRVRVLPVAPPADEPQAALEHLDAALTAALGGLEGRPLILIGADASAAALGALVAGGDSAKPWWPGAVVLAGLPGYGGHDVDGWESELEVRSHCPTHRGTLSNDENVHRGSLSAAVGSGLLDLAYGSTSTVPHLLLAGDTDPLADRAAVSGLAKSLVAARFSVVRQAHHDVLNDLQHRSVAAEVVSFLEVVRGGQPLEPIVTPESSSW